MKPKIDFIVITIICALITYLCMGCASTPKRYDNHWVWHPDMAGTSNW